MKMRYNVAACLFMLLMFLSSCGEDRTYEYLELTQENQWIYEKMQDVYLWSDSMKRPDRKSFFAKESAFFQSLLQRNDRFSHFADSAINTSYGLSYAIMRDPLGVQKSKSYALVLFVEPGSPAANAGLKRGDWITKIGKYALNASNYGYLDRGGAASVFTSRIVLDEESMEYVWQEGDTLQMGAATTLSPIDVYVDTVYSQRGRKIGYLVCNSFSADGKEAILSSIESFKQQNVGELIIDLRYNRGGSIAVAAEAASMIVPAENVGGTFCKLAYNSLNSNCDTIYKYVQSNTLSLGKVYIICGAETRGAAEAFIAALRTALGYNNVAVIGETTAGEYVATETIESPYNFSITPAVAFVENGDGASLYSAGVVPGYTMDELSDFYRIYNLGNTQEYMLYNTIYYIVNGSFPQYEAAKANVSSKSLPAYGKSISR
ncbi:MAG: hypothetical protein IKU50_06395 [Bacteroidaceae bacterium]|nr:hypothetical protein [Bacteroidaceae bacterium]